MKSIKTDSFKNLENQLEHFYGAICINSPSFCCTIRLYKICFKVVTYLVCYICRFLCNLYEKMVGQRELYFARA